MSTKENLLGSPRGGFGAERWLGSQRGGFGAPPKREQLTSAEAALNSLSTSDHQKATLDPSQVVTRN